MKDYFSPPLSFKTPDEPSQQPNRSVISVVLSRHSINPILRRSIATFRPRREGTDPALRGLRGGNPIRVSTGGET